LIKRFCGFKSYFEEKKTEKELIMHKISALKENLLCVKLDENDKMQCLLVIDT
jgi:hypothetical protein